MSKGYILPDAPDTDDYYYLCVAVPRAYEYLIAFYGSLDYLAKWVAWERDGTDRAAQAAAVWRAANEITRANGTDCTGGDDMQLRQRPDNPCVLQASDDGGSTWYDVYNASLCSVPPSPPGDVDERGRYDDIIYYIWQLVIDVDTAIQAGTPTNTIKQDTVTKLNNHLGSSKHAAATVKLIDDMANATQSERDAVTNSSKWQQVRDDSWCQNRDDRSDYADYYQWIVEAGIEIGGILVAAADSLTQDIGAFVGALPGLDVDALDNMAQLAPIYADAVSPFTDTVCPQDQTPDYDYTALTITYEGAPLYYLWEPVTGDPDWIDNYWRTVSYNGYLHLRQVYQGGAPVTFKRIEVKYHPLGSYTECTPSGFRWYTYDDAGNTLNYNGQSWGTVPCEEWVYRHNEINSSGHVLGFRTRQSSGGHAAISGIRITFYNTTDMEAF